jgi:hypothetical protein
MADAPEFFVDAKPAAALFASLSELDSTNPIYTYAYACAMASLGRKPVVIGLRQSGKMVCGCPTFLSIGRLSRSLEIPSLPSLPEAFWNGLLRYCSAQRITHLSVQTFASHESAIPNLSGETSRRPRWEYSIDLTSADLTSTFGKEHRRLARRATERGMQLVRTNNLDGVKEHLRVSQFSTDRRRSRGEDVGNDNERVIGALLQSGCGEIFQAIESGEILSSIVVMKAKRGAYLFAAGTTGDGMKAGASHFLIAKTAELLQQEGFVAFNLGGVDDIDSGLAAYKMHFGTTINPLQSAEFFVGSSWQRKLQTAVELLRGDRERLKNALFGRSRLWKVYSVTPDQLVRVDSTAGVEVRKLSDDDIATIAMPSWLRREQEDRIRRLDFNGAYGAFCDGRLAHISWLIPALREQPRTLSLRPNEAEISACITLPEFRGRNLYPITIAHIARDVKQDIRTIYMKTTVDNIGSQRGLLKAGLQPCRWVLEYEMPRWLGRREVTIRGFRWQRKRLISNHENPKSCETNRAVREVNVQP